MGHRDKERRIFQCFLDAYPRLKDWEQPKAEAEFPDVICHTPQGGTEGVELGEWLNESQMHDSVQREKNEHAILHTLQDIELPFCVRSVLLTLRTNSPKFARGDSKELRREFVDLMTNTSGSWPSQPGWHSAQGYPHRDFTGFPTLGRCLCEVHFNRLFAPVGIGFDLPGGAYSPDVAFESLLEIVERKAAHYGRAAGMPLNLLVHYSTGYVHNTPYRGLETPTFSDVAARASAQLSRRFDNSQRPFQSIYLLEAVEPAPKAFLIWPGFRPCRAQTAGGDDIVLHVLATR